MVFICPSRILRAPCCKLRIEEKCHQCKRIQTINRKRGSSRDSCHQGHIVYVRGEAARERTGQDMGTAEADFLVQARTRGTWAKP